VKLINIHATIISKADCNIDTEYVINACAKALENHGIKSEIYLAMRPEENGVTMLSLESSFEKLSHKSFILRFQPESLIEMSENMMYQILEMVKTQITAICSIKSVGVIFIKLAMNISP
jgi:hypothetical protein